MKALKEKENYRGKWFVVHYLKENFGEFYTYQPREFKGSVKILADGFTLSMYNTREQMLEFKKCRDKVYVYAG